MVYTNKKRKPLDIYLKAFLFLDDSKRSLKNAIGSNHILAVLLHLYRTTFNLNTK